LVWLAVSLVLLFGSARPAVPRSDASTPGGETEARLAVDNLLTLMRQRLLLQHQVARYKWRAQLPITDARREQELLATVVAQGRALGLEAGPVRQFFQAQLQAGKLVQQADFDRWQKTGKPPPTSGPDLKALRADLDSINEKLLEALGKTEPWLRQQQGQKLLTDRLPVVLQGEGITQPVRQAACAPLLRP
jgi:chorismate mutase